MAFTIENGILKEYIPEDGETEIVIPEGVTEIGDGAFRGCRNLTEIHIPEGVMKVGNSAFRQNEQLTAVTMPESLTNIGSGAFYGCRNLSGIRIPENVTNIGTGAFRSCQSLTSLALPEGMTSIGNFAFDGCTSLKYALIPESIKRIGVSAFDGCTSLKSVVIPENIRKIADNAFRNCGSIRLFGITFAPEVFREIDFIKARKLLKTGAFPMKLDTGLLCAAAVAYWLETGDADALIGSHLSRIMQFLVKNNITEVIRKMLEWGKFITAENIDECISLAIEHTQNGGSPEIQTMLMHYKSEVLGYRDPEREFKL